MSPCPITADFLPPHLRKHVDLAAPVPLRMMAAKTLVPFSPKDLVGAVFMLTFDPDPAVREAAEKSARALPERFASTAFRDEAVQPPVLSYFLSLFPDRDDYAQLLLLNPSTPDEAVALLSASCTAKTAELVGQNQLRLLRHEGILRGLCQNPQASPAVLDGVCDFAVRSGVNLPDLAQMAAARVRIFGPEVSAPPDPGPTAAEMMGSPELKDEAAPPLEEGARLTLTQRVMKMSVSEKIKLATLGNKEARGLLLRDTNKLVALAAIQSPRITDGEVMLVAQNRAISDDVLRVVYLSREWTKHYPIKVALVKNPKVPLAIAMKFLATLRESEVREISRSRNVATGVQTMAKKMLDAKK